QQAGLEVERVEMTHRAGAEDYQHILGSGSEMRPSSRVGLGRIDLGSDRRFVGGQQRVVGQQRSQRYASQSASHALEKAASIEQIPTGGRTNEMLVHDCLFDSDPDRPRSLYGRNRNSLVL